MFESAPASGFECLLENYNPALTVTTLQHLGSLTKHFPVALREFDSCTIISNLRKPHFDKAS